jgi:DNA-directed RNA polymerase specialized sigma24 family protein
MTKRKSVTWEVRRPGGISNGEKYRQVITLFYMEDRSYEEVSRLLDLPLGTVKTYLHRAKKELAAAMTQDKMTEGGR